MVRRGLGVAPPESNVPAAITDVPALRDALQQVGYFADVGLATCTYLGLAMARPILVEGEPGVGKTYLAEALADLLDAPLLRLQCYEGIDAAQAVYEWSYPRQLLHIRALEAAGALVDTDEIEADLFREEFLIRRPLLQAVSSAEPQVLLVDEVDRADDEFEAFLLEVLAAYSVTVPELGTFRAPRAPVVVLTSNRTRELHDALKRRCLYHWIAHPDFEREVAILRHHLPAIEVHLARQITALTRDLRDLQLVKPPGVAETLDWARALVVLGQTGLEATTVDASLGSVLKYREDLDRVRAAGIGALVDDVVARHGRSG